MRRLSAALVATVPLVLSLGTAPGVTAAPRAPKPAVPALRAEVSVAPPAGRAAFKPGEAARVTGRLLARNGKPVAGTFTLRVSDPNGRELGRLPGVRSGKDGRFEATVPGSVTKGVRPLAGTGHRTTLAVRVVDAKAGKAFAPTAGAAALAVAAAVAGIELENNFTSAVGWVKPGQTYPFRVIVRNYDASDSGVVVTVPEVEGMRFTKVETGASAGTAALAAGRITWTLGSVPAGQADAPVARALIVEGRADSTAETPTVVWRDLSTTATLTYDGGTRTSTTHGPKVIPPDEIYDTARYGDRPFPVVPVDYFDRSHEPAHSGDLLLDKINDPKVPGSTFNLWQENSYGQLYPHATVPSAGMATAGWPEKIEFSTPEPNGVCPPDGLVTAAELQDTPAYSERITDGWYRLPGTTNYYGTDRFGPQTAIAGSVAGQALLADIDSACGPTAKAVYDAAAIADPEIDYSDFDTDKDGVVDFFMMVFVGYGGHGESALSGVPPYDNIWPHSSSLEFTYTDEQTGLAGYRSKDQLKDLLGRPLWYTDKTYSNMTTDDLGDDLKVHVRVGPYNVNPESAIENASVISHEYGHSLGLPDFYSTGDRETYGDWNLMATDKSQNLDVYTKQELGWIVPRVLGPGVTKVEGWRDSKVDTHRIDWRTEDGKPYTLSGAGVHNGEAYTAKLKGRQLISPEKVAQGASPTHVWWSGSGNDYGCAPNRAHNFDIALPELADVADGAEVTLEFASYWDIEWDYDYGFVLTSGDRGQTYTSVPSENGYTTPSTQNPNANQCQAKYGNGITGTSGSYQAGTVEVDRVATTPGGTQYPDGPFLPDKYDISDLAGTEGAVVRFSYATDPGLARPGWFVDNVVVKVDGEPIYDTDFEDFEEDRPRLFNGGCQDSVKVAPSCTKGWQWISSDADATADHGYYLEMRDRSGFDFDGKGENDRAAIAFTPGMLLVYTDEAHGYGNAGTDDPPAQSPLDANPTPEDLTPNLNDAAFVSGGEFDDRGWVDNYEDPRTESGQWEFRYNCLSFKVDSMSGDDIGPDTAVGVGGDLVGDVTFRTTPRCAPFNYGYAGTGPNAAPVGRIELKPMPPVAGSPVTFDGSQSFDDRQAPPDLTYEWAFGDGATATGRTVRHVYARPGSYEVTLTVTDKDGAQSETGQSVTVRARGDGNVEQGGTEPERTGPGAGPGTIPTTGGSETLVLLAVLGSAAAALLRRRAARAA
ncbi:MAG TPA: PKD domain-containing protein [Frankiaceae bacterium]|nr:PKD domain-containing protein [Frankiaceae bacterium]